MRSYQNLRTLSSVVCFLVTLAFATQLYAAECVPAAGWASVDASGAHPVAAPELYARLARRQVILLGEEHDNAEHHRWQLQTLTALHALHPNMVLAFEMFPRRVQPALDKWVAGELSEADFLTAAEWRRVWNFDPQLYLPIFHYARMNRIPMVAANVDAELVRDVNAKGYDGVPPDKRADITRPAAPSAAYLAYLLAVYAQHESRGPGKPDSNDPAFRRFVDSQQLWDRALAQGIADSLSRHNGALVIGIMGVGHVASGFGVRHQLQDLGLTNVASLLPWEHTANCRRLVAGYADAVFGVPPVASAAAAQRPRLGVQIEAVPGGVRILQVVSASVAEVAGLRAGDIVTEAAGAPVAQIGDLIETVQRQAFGTWLPLKVKRGNELFEIVTKFPRSP